MSERPIRLLIVDDSALYRQTLQNRLRDLEEVSVVGIAKNGNDALEKIVNLEPDLLTLDVEMPDMSGIEVLRQINARQLHTKAIMVSSFTCAGAQITTDALLEGAFDFILKPSGSDPEENRRLLFEELTQKIHAFRQNQHRPRAGERRNPKAVSSLDAADRAPEPESHCRAVLIGISTGGPAALRTVLPRLPREFPVPILIVQHMAPQFTTSLAKRLNEMSEIRVVEASNGMEIEPGTVHIAPGGHQMKIQCQGDRALIQLTEDPPENNCRPAADYLFRSAATELGGNVLGVIMTGMGRDGVKGCQAVKDRGGFVFAQAEEGCVVYGMPKAVIEEGLADRALNLGKIAPAIVRHVKRSRRAQQ